MRTITLTIIALFLYESLFSQSEVYFQKMGESLEQFSSIETPEDYLEVAAAFERISTVETEQWLPLYYHAQCYVLVSFVDQEADTDKKDAYLDVAEKSIEKIKLLAPEEAEIHALESFLYTGRLVINPMERGMTFGAKSNASIQKALALDPANPRAKYLKLTGDIGTAKFFGQETSKYCGQASELHAVWDDYIIPSPIHPSWGKELVESIMNDCESNTETEKVEEETTTELKPEKGEDGAYSLTINITNLKSDNGQILVELLDEKEESVDQYKLEVSENSAYLLIENLPIGSYSIQYFHDENENGTMDKNGWGAPTEAYGFSNNVRGGFGPPDFQETLFEFSADLSLSLNAK